MATPVSVSDELMLPKKPVEGDSAIYQSIDPGLQEQSPPVRLIQDDHLVPARRQRDLRLREHLDLVPHHINPPACAVKPS